MVPAQPPSLGEPPGESASSFALPPAQRQGRETNISIQQYKLNLHSIVYDHKESHRLEHSTHLKNPLLHRCSSHKAIDHHLQIGKQKQTSQLTHCMCCPWHLSRSKSHCHAMPCSLTLLLCPILCALLKAWEVHRHMQRGPNDHIQYTS